MNFWIQGKRKSLIEALERVNLLLISEAEARTPVEDPILVRPASKTRPWGRGAGGAEGAGGAAGAAGSGVPARAVAAHHGGHPGPC